MPFQSIEHVVSHAASFVLLADDISFGQKGVEFQSYAARAITMSRAPLSS